MCLHGFCWWSCAPAGRVALTDTPNRTGGQDVAGVAPWGEGETPRHPTPRGRDATCARRLSSGGQGHWEPSSYLKHWGHHTPHPL